MLPLCTNNRKHHRAWENWTVPIHICGLVVSCQAQSVRIAWIPIVPLGSNMLGRFGLIASLILLCPALADAVMRDDTGRGERRMNPGENGALLRSCRATQVFPLANNDSLLASASAIAIPAESHIPFEAGWLQQTLDDTSTAALGGERYHGLQALGFRALSFRNRNARPGVLGIYAGTQIHRSGPVACRRIQLECPGL